MTTVLYYYYVEFILTVCLNNLVLYFNRLFRQISTDCFCVVVAIYLHCNVYNLYLLYFGSKYMENDLSINDSVLIVSMLQNWLMA